MTARAQLLPRAPLFWPFVMLAANGVASGLLFSLNRLAAEGGVPFIAYVFWASLFAGGVLLIASFAAGTPPPLSAAHLRAYAITGSAAIAFPMSLFAFVASKVPASVIALELALVPMITYGLALALAMERFRWLSFAGIALGLGGVLFIVIPDASLPDPSMAGWVLLSLLAPASFALSNVAAARFRPPRTASLAMAAAMSLAAAAFLAPAMIVEGSGWFFDSGLDTGGWAVLGLAIVFALLFTLFFEIVRLAGPVFFSTVNYIVPISGVVLAMLIFGERLSPWLWTALALMLAGLAVMNARGRRPPAQSRNGIGGSGGDGTPTRG